MSLSKSSFTSTFAILFSPFGLAVFNEVSNALYITFLEIFNLETIPNSAGGIPLDSDDFPLHSVHVPLRADDFPLDADDIPTAAGGFPVAADGFPVAADGIPSRADNLPHQARFVLRSAKGTVAERFPAFAINGL